MFSGLDTADIRPSVYNALIITLTVIVTLNLLKWVALQTQNIPIVDAFGDLVLNT